MCVQYLRGCSVPWGYHEYCGGNLEYRGGVQYRGGDIMINVGDILSTVVVFRTLGGYNEYHGGYHATCGGYHEYRESVQYHRGINVLLFEYLHGTEPHPTVLMILPQVS